MRVLTDNVIRFPVQPTLAPQRVSEPVRPPAVEGTAQVVEFTPAGDAASLDERAREHGQLFVAQRIVSRVADQLDQLGTL